MAWAPRTCSYTRRPKPLERDGSNTSAVLGKFLSASLCRCNRASQAGQTRRLLASLVAGHVTLP